MVTMDDRHVSQQLERCYDVVGGMISATRNGFGECDPWEGLGDVTRRRIMGARVHGSARLVGKGGAVSWDDACERWNDAHGTDLDVDGFVDTWSATVLACLDHRRDRREGVTPDDERERPDPREDLPTWARSWVSELLNDDKREYATALLLAVYLGDPLPPDPGASWVDKVQRKVMNRYNAAVARGEISEVE